MLFVSKKLRLAGLFTVLAFAAPSVSGLPWSEFTEKKLADSTHYEIDSEAMEVVVANSDQSASALIRRGKINLEDTPILCWRWRADQFPKVEDITTKSGDDFAARVYVIAERGLMGLRSRSINYVWTEEITDLEFWTNPFAESVVMIPVHAGPASESGKWASESRNVAEDFKRFLDTNVNHIDAVAIMTDADNSASKAAASYERLRFVSDADRCSEDA